MGAVGRMVGILLAAMAVSVLPVTAAAAIRVTPGLDPVVLTVTASDRSPSAVFAAVVGEPTGMTTARVFAHSLSPTGSILGTR